MIGFLISWYLYNGITGFGWVFLIAGIALDISTHAGAGYRNRDRLRRD
ncbi:MAG: hypothetical protein ACYCXK_01290 [Candidatus Humimicrobiaceae bacterium]